MGFGASQRSDSIENSEEPPPDRVVSETNSSGELGGAALTSKSAIVVRLELGRSVRSNAAFSPGIPVSTAGIGPVVGHAVDVAPMNRPIHQEDVAASRADVARSRLLRNEHEHIVRPLRACLKNRWLDSLCPMVTEIMAG